jgi:hypothetical protein
MRLLIIITTLCGISFAQTFQKNEVKLKVKAISSLIKSTKTKYKDSYLFIAKVIEFSKSIADGSIQADLETAVVKDTLIEVLLPSSACANSAKTAFINPSYTLEFLNLKLTRLIPAAVGKEYEYFAILDIQKNGDKTLAGCKLSKK